MESLIPRLSPVLHLTRITTAFAAVGNVWFVILWTRAVEQERVAAPAALLARPSWLLLGAGGVFAVGLFVFATALNDTLDMRRDRAMHPDRPLPSGRLSVETAVWLVAAALLASIGAATLLGLSAVMMATLAGVAILFYDSAAKRVPSVGLVLVGLIYAAHMLVGNVDLVFVWPVWVAMSHALAVGAITHHLSDKRPRLSPPVLAVAASGWLFWSGALLGVGWRRSGEAWPSWASPTGGAVVLALAALFALLAWFKASRATSRTRAAEKVQRYGSLWLTLYATAWLAGQELWAQAAVLGALAGLGFLGMTTLREAYSLLEHPVGYRR